MAHYAELNEDNTVTKVRTGADEEFVDLEKIYTERFGKVHKRTSYNTKGGIHYNPETKEPSIDQSKAFRKNYAGVGYTYDKTRDAFIPPQPYPSWTLNEETCLWDSPVPYPTDGNPYIWNEETQTWDLLENN
jgi:hypothetical protein